MSFLYYLLTYSYLRYIYIYIDYLFGFFFIANWREFCVNITGFTRQLILWRYLLYLNYTYYYINKLFFEYHIVNWRESVILNCTFIFQSFSKKLITVPIRIFTFVWSYFIHKVAFLCANNSKFRLSVYLMFIYHFHWVDIKF